MKPDVEDDRQDEAARLVWDGSAQLRDESGTGVDVSADCVRARADVEISRASAKPSRLRRYLAKRIDSASGRDSSHRC
jgi:hypothetical protein